MAELWYRPWAMAQLDRRHRVTISGERLRLLASPRSPLWIYVPPGEDILLNGRRGTAEPVSGFNSGTASRELLLLPLPLKAQPPLSVKTGKQTVLLEWPDTPEIPPAKSNPVTEQEQKAHRLSLRAKTVWDRLNDVDLALADPAQLWPVLRRRWTDQSPDSPPRMDVIVRQALSLVRILDLLERAPRRVLRRTHQHVPVSRVQELDRRAMTWLVRQPGETLAERAGERQRLLAVAREENFDTLENRVLRAYAELAAWVARDYVSRNRSKFHTRRAQRVQDFGKRCRRLGHELAARGVRLAEAGVTPNFVLQQNPSYHAIWTAWMELLDLTRQLDDIWRWQARSWEEFCALALIVALVGIDGALIVAAAPLTFRDEQYRGAWVDHDNPLVVVHLPEQGLVVEVRYRMRQPHKTLADFGAPIWVRIGRVNAFEELLGNIPVWPMWDIEGGLVEGEVAELDDVVAVGARAQIVSGLALRPAASDGRTEQQTGRRAISATIGVEGPALREGLERLTHYFTAQLAGERRK